MSENRIKELEQHVGILKGQIREREDAENESYKGLTKLLNLLGRDFDSLAYTENRQNDNVFDLVVEIVDGYQGRIRELEKETK